MLCTLLILQEYEWYIIPILNPDGYDFVLDKKEKSSSRSELKYLKNRNPNNDVENTKKCFGVAINRNFEFHWRGKVPKNFCI